MVVSPIGDDNRPTGQDGEGGTNMASEQLETLSPPPYHVHLRDPWLAALWAWLWPGAGHLYQGRYVKGGIFMTCILLTYFFGLAIGGGHVVYASFRQPDLRLHYLLQVGVGLPALPALVQTYRQRTERGPLFGWKAMYPPDVRGEQIYDELAEWNAQYGFYFELGTLYTMVAGLLNVLAIYDAHSGPVWTMTSRDRRPPDPG